MPRQPGARVADFAAGLLFKSARVTDVAEHEGFRTIELGGADLRNQEWVPGDKLRIRAGALALRTYTPISWDPERGTTRFLAYTHGGGPGAQWCRAAQPGTACQLRGPDRSIRLDRVAAATVFVGDETSFGLLVALHTQRPQLAPVASLFEVSDIDSARAMLRDHDVDASTLLSRTPADAHLDVLGQQVLEAVRAHADAPLILSGRAQTIASLRRVLKTAGFRPRETVVKAYWDVNRKGLD